MASQRPPRELPPWFLFQLAVTTLQDPRSNGPFPVRFRAVGARDVWALWLQQHLPIELYQTLGNPAAPPLISDGAIKQLLLTQVAAAVPALTPAHRNSFATDNAHIITVSSAYWARQGTIIEPTPALVEMLSLTDITRELPASLLRMPFPALYFHGQLLQPERGSNIEGAFLFEHLDDGVRCLTLVPVRRDPKDVMWVDAMVVTIVDETVSLVDCLKQHVSGDWAAQLEVLAKILLYLGLKEARQSKQTPYSDASRTFPGIGRKKKNQRLEAIERLYDRILVGPEAAPETSSTLDYEHSIRPHWRRGHFRHQPHGPGNRERRLIFIAPVLVRASGLNEEPTQPKTYRPST